MTPTHDASDRPVRSTRRAVLAALTLAAGIATAGLLGCGGSSDGRGIPVPPGGGVAIGNIVCVNTTVMPNTNMVVQGGQLTIQFNLIDVNQLVPGAHLPIAFDVVGGSLSNPPTETDANGRAVVIFTASTTYVGFGRVRLIQPDQQLDCDVSFTIFEPGLVLTSKTTTLGGATVHGYDACGSTEANVQFTDRRRVVFKVTQVNPDTLAVEPRAGIYVHVVASPDLGLAEDDYGPTDVNGELNLLLPPFPRRFGDVFVTGVAVRPDLDGDGLPDPIDSNTCTVTFNLETVCDPIALAVVYFDEDGSVKAAPLRPGESATVTATVLIDGAAQANYPLLFSTETGGLINGSANPVHVLTNGAGQATVLFTVQPGVEDANIVVTVQAEAGDILCTKTASLSAVTCDFTVEFNPPPVDGGDSMVTLTLLNADSDTAEGEFVSLDVIGGQFTAQPPHYQLMDSGGGVLQVQALLHVTPGFSGQSQISMSFVGGYPCTTITKNFVVGP